MGLKAPSSNISLTNTITITPPPHTTQQQVSPFSLFQILLSPPYVYIFIALGILIVVFVVVYLAFRKSYMKDPIRNGLIRQIRRSKNSDVVEIGRAHV